MTASVGLVARVCQPSTLRMVICPDASSAQKSMAAVSGDGRTVWVLMRRLNSSCRRSTALVTGMKISVPRFGRGRRDRGVWCDHPGQRHREHEGAGRPMRTMSRELVLVAGRLCDPPGCAASADP
jgi:hypothetical protein